MDTPSLRTYIQEIAKLTARGLEPEQIRQTTDLDLSVIRKAQADEAFEPALRAISPEAADLWNETQTAIISRKRVKIAAREDAPEHYRMIRDIVREGNLNDRDKLQALLKLLDFSGAADENVEDEQISLSPSQLALITETLRELN